MPKRCLLRNMHMYVDAEGALVPCILQNSVCVLPFRNKVFILYILHYMCVQVYIHTHTYIVCQFGDSASKIFTSKIIYIHTSSPIYSCDFMSALPLLSWNCYKL